jgi:hypothetical protein
MEGKRTKTEAELIATVGNIPDAEGCLLFAKLPRQNDAGADEDPSHRETGTADEDPPRRGRGSPDPD